VRADFRFKNVFVKKNLDLFVGKDKNGEMWQKWRKNVFPVSPSTRDPTFLEHFGPLEESDLEIFDHLTFKTNKYIP